MRAKHPTHKKQPLWKRALQSMVEKKEYTPNYFQQIYFEQPGKPVWTPREYKRFAEEAYRRNVVAYRSINLVVQAAASVPWALYEINGSEKRELREHPILRLLSSPNPNCAGAEFFESVYAYKLISGNAYILSVGLENQLPSELYALRPDRVSVVPGRDGRVSAYQYEVDKKTTLYRVNRLTGESAILHLKHFHPLCDWYGMSPIEAAAYSIDQHNQASVWNQALLQNGAKPSGALVVKDSAQGGPGSLSDDQFQRVRAQIEEHFSGAMNAGRPLLLEGGLDWKEMSLSPKDMDFIDSKHSSARDIAQAFGVPPQLLGIPGDNAYNNLAEARLALWEQTVIPMLEHISSTLNHWLVSRYPGNLKLSYDTDRVSALAPRREAVWSKLEGATFMTVNEKRQAVGLDPMDGGDIREIQNRRTSE